MQNSSQREDLIKYLKNTQGRVGVAVSGGVDSTLLIVLARKYCKEVHGFFMKSILVSDDDEASAREVCELFDIELTTIHWEPLKIKEIAINSHERCYHCKLNLYKILLNEANLREISILFDGSNYDDILKGYNRRPGLKALEELNIKTPLATARLRKDEIRAWARELGIPTHNRPSKACKAIKIPHGLELEEKSLI